MIEHIKDITILVAMGLLGAVALANSKKDVAIQLPGDIAVSTKDDAK